MDDIRSNRLWVKDNCCNKVKSRSLRYTSPIFPMPRHTKLTLDAIRSVGDEECSTVMRSKATVKGTAGQNGQGHSTAWLISSLHQQRNGDKIKGLLHIPSTVPTVKTGVGSFVQSMN